jgi:multidrug efflux pump subunit AcrA (membrane-fusion protein)
MDLVFSIPLRPLAVLIGLFLCDARAEEAKAPVKSESAKPTAPKAEAPKAEAAKPKPVAPASTISRVTAGPLVQKVKLSGTVESERATPLEMNLKRWGDLTVIRAAAHGTTVKAGDVILELETKDLVKKIEEMKRELPTKELDLAAAELDLGKAEKATPLSLERASREKVQAEQDLAYFEDESRPMQERAVREDVKEVNEALSYAREELNQLRKMYEKDDLTEETEEIILKRAENSVARYEWMLEQTQARAERTLNVMLPREHEGLKRSLELRQIEWRAGEKAMRDGLEKARLATAAKRREMEEFRKTLAELEEDLGAMRVTAPHDGIVYYGMSQRAKWITASMVDKKLLPGGKLMMREVFMTVVDPGKVRVLLSLTEEQLKDLSVGQKGVCQAKWKPDFKFDAKLESVLLVPYSDKTFDAVLSIRKPANSPALLPGMSADAEVTVYEKPEALLVPKAALKREGDRDLVTMKDGKAVAVKTGRQEGDRVEILEGLKAGDEIRVPKPEAPKSEPAKSGEPKSAAPAPDPAKKG